MPRGSCASRRPLPPPTTTLPPAPVGAWPSIDLRIRSDDERRSSDSRDARQSGDSRERSCSEPRRSGTTSQSTAVGRRDARGKGGRVEDAVHPHRQRHAEPPDRRRRCCDCADGEYVIGVGRARRPRTWRERSVARTQTRSRAASEETDAAGKSRAQPESSGCRPRGGSPPQMTGYIGAAADEVAESRRCAVRQGGVLRCREAVALPTARRPRLPPPRRRCGCP